ncbi:MAG: hypothetical protein JWR09_1949 [Mucilaginibacter sp.]|nr:hypothetical protein [Mucilaginibacter sp.]
MKKISFALLAVAFIYSSCTKDHSITPAKNNSFKISFAATLNTVAVNTWEQVLGGEAIVQFTPENSDSLSLSSKKDSLDLKNISTYNYQLVGGTYTISLSTKSTSVADTFIRFTSEVKDFAVNKDQTISLPATTNDGVITISKSTIDSTVMPTFTPLGTTTPINFGLANGYYFLYIKGATTGRLTFTEATTGDLYLKDLKVTAGNQYDISATLNTIGAIVIHSYPFHLKTSFLQ